MTVLLHLFFPLHSSAHPLKKYWIYFSDKGPISEKTGNFLSKGSTAYAIASTIIQPRALERRAKVLPKESLVDVSDLPIYQPYVEAVRRAGGVVVHESRWMNAASFWCSAEQRNTIQTLPFVLTTSPVASFRTRKVDYGKIAPVHPPAEPFGMNYGISQQQVQMMNVPPLHDIGITGKDVLLGMLDSGFRWRTHEALRSRNVIAEHDFVNNDDITANEANDGSDQDEHGTLTMSLAGGYFPGILIGPAFNASFILGKTENLAEETRQEEDNWAAALEWMEAKGVDVVSSSLGYNVFDDGTGYQWDHGDFDGRTSITAKAAVRAVRLGVVVCNSMGNEDWYRPTIPESTGTMLTPADADSIISVGAVSFARELAGFSSTGPTNDGRFKPDVVAPGVRGMILAIPPNSYSTNYQGTSLATPMVAGAAALLLSARPELTPVQVRDILRSTAESVDTIRHPIIPNNFVGWGLVNAFTAVLSFGPIFSNRVEAHVMNAQSIVSTIVVSKYGVRSSSVLLHYAMGSDTTSSTIAMLFDSSMFYTTSGKYSVVIPPVSFGTVVRFTIEATDSNDHSYQSPALMTQSVWELHYGVEGVKKISTAPATIPSGYTLFQNYPNPFNAQTIITYDIPQQHEAGSIKVYTVLGQEIATLKSGIFEPGSGFVAQFDGTNFPTGVYFYRLTTPSFTMTKKMLLLK